MLNRNPGRWLTVINGSLLLGLVFLPLLALVGAAITDTSMCTKIRLVQNLVCFLRGKHIFYQTLFYFRFFDVFSRINENRVVFFEKLKKPFNGPYFDTNRALCIGVTASVPLYSR